MNTSLRLVPAAVAATMLLVSQASAQEDHCKLWPEGGLVAQSYELIGAEACMQVCTETEDCNAWSYTPHNFNPDNAPGECRMMSAVAEQEDHDRDFCGRID